MKPLKAILYLFASIILTFSIVSCGGGGSSSTSSTDTDGDGVADSSDLCPNVVGNILNKGCPLGDTDTEAPTTPIGLAATASSYSQIDLSWTASTDNVAVTGYNIYRDSTLVSSSAIASYSDTGLTASTYYCYTVTAYDAAGNESNQSAQDCATTLSTPDVSAPSIPTGLTATAASTTQINLSWTASTDDAAVTGYNVYNSLSVLIAVSNTTSYRHTGLTPGTNYCYTVTAVDTSDIESLTSTQQCATPPDLTDLVSASIDWRPQDFFNSRGISGVIYNSTMDYLALSCDLKGQNANLSNGEIVLDLKYVPTLESSVPIDMTDKTITIEVVVPPGFIGPPSSPNGIQIFVKDVDYLSQYGPWTNILSSGTVTMALTPSVLNPIGGETSAGFDPALINTIGLKFGINSLSAHEFNGEITVNKYEITPPLPFLPLPVMPEGTPVSYVNNLSDISLQSDGFYSDGKKWFIVGGNWRATEYGQNFGTTAWFPYGNGASFHRGFLSTRLKLFRDAGVTLVRVGLIDDGRTLLDINGNVTGYNNAFRKDVSAFLDLAAENNMKVEFVLFDFLIAGKEEAIEGVWLRGRREIFDNPTTRAQFITNFLEPFLTEFGSHPALFGIDLMNEPEWIISSIEGGGWEDVIDGTKDTTPVSIANINSYFNESIDTIRRLAPGKFITIGVSFKFIPLVKDLRLDYLALHHYPWMGGLGNNIANIPNSRVWILEEFPGIGDTTSYLSTVYSAGGHGALLWNLSPKTDDQSYQFNEEESKLLEMRRFVDETDGSILP